jgi:predicted nucleic acid-binding protein
LSEILVDNPITSRLTKVEVLRKIRKVDSELIPRADLLLSQMLFAEMTESVLSRAENYPAEISAKSADAIHLATAETLSPLIDGVLTLDKQMATNARKLGLRVFEEA